MRSYQIAMPSISKIVAKTKAMFDLFDHHFYNDEFTCPAITVSPDGRRGDYGGRSTSMNRCIKYACTYCGTIMY